MPLRLPPARPGDGVALAREWTADVTETLGAAENLDALLLAAERQEDLFGMLLAAMRLDLPAVCLPPPGTPLSAAAALGLAPLSGETPGVVVELGAGGGPRPGKLVSNFSLANALRAGIVAGGGPEVLVHLASLAREAGIPGFSQMLRVLAPETPVAEPGWTRDAGLPALLASLGEDLHDVPTVTGDLKENLPPAAPTPPEHRRLAFIRARASGAEAICLVSPGVSELAGECRVYRSEEAAVRAVESGEVPDEGVLVLNGYGPRGAGLLRLEVLDAALRDAELRVSVLTDGLPPEDAWGAWASLFTPEATSGGVIGLLRDGDPVRLDIEGGRIRASIEAGGLETREPFEFDPRAGAGYAARHARSALPALEGAGFG